MSITSIPSGDAESSLSCTSVQKEENWGKSQVERMSIWSKLSEVDCSVNWTEILHGH